MIVLSRFKSTSDGTFGKLTVDGKVFYSVERPWLNNKPEISCVPSGQYLLVPHSSRKYGQVLALVNEEIGVTHFQESYSKRFACLIHVANYARDVIGCIGLGERHIENMVTSSRKAIADFYSMVNPNETHELLIKWEEV
jgi:hypothetical protein